MAAKSYIQYNIFSLALTALAALSSVSCSTDPEIYEPETPPAGVVLRLSTGSTFTRADGDSADSSTPDAGHTDGETTIVPDPYAEANEELIDRVALFFFDSEDSSDKQPFYIHIITGINKFTATDMTVKVPIERIDKFTDDKKAYIYALVNLPDEIDVDEKANTISYGSGSPMPATLENLHHLWVSTSEFAPSGEGATAAVPSSFVMRGGTTAELVDDSKLVYVKGSIKLERLASKIRLWANIPDFIYVDRETGLTVDESKKNDENIDWWRPMLQEADGNGKSRDAIKLYIYNIAQRGRIDGYLSGYEADYNYSAVARANESQKNVVRLLEDENDGLRLPDKDKDDNYKHSHTIAYYSYPNKWDSSSPSEQHQTYVILTIPWGRVDKNAPDRMPSEFDVYYYQIPVNALRDPGKDDSERLDPNRYYRIKLKVGMLGSKDLGSALPVDASWEVVPWVTEDVDVSIKPRRYLVVNQKEWVMNNVWTLEIPFSTSHETEVEACYVNYFRYSDIWGTSDNTDGEHNATEFTEWLDAATGNREKEYPGLTGDRKSVV